MIICQFTGSSSDKSWRSILACMAFADSFLISAFSASTSLIVQSLLVFCNVREFVDHLNTRLDVSVPFPGQLGEVVEPEAMHVTQLLVDDDQAAANEHHAAKAFMAHLQHRRDHHACLFLD